MMIDAIRGRNLNDQDFASSTTVMDLEGGSDFGAESLPTRYDAKFLDDFFGKRPLVAFSRTLKIATTLSGVATGLLVDVITGQSGTPESQVRNAVKLRESITSLGPFFIKLGQALSIRPDILAPRAMVEMQQLCDKVPSYDSGRAFEIMCKELGVETVDEVFSEITPEPVAAASLGQVYKAKIKATKEEVAVKVQRPGVLETVSLDLYLVRKFGSLVKSLPGQGGGVDVVALLDEFAFRFYDELDYNLECRNGEKVREQMKTLGDKVRIPKNYPELTRRRVHTAEWCEGEKLSQSTASDVGALVNLGVIVYLTMLLEFGFFHADPHPGNMLRGENGELIILDFGLMTEVSENARLGMVEAIVHLLNRDYEEIGGDFVNLEFIPQGTDVRPIVPALTTVFDAALAGGGAKSINFQEVAADLAEITFKFDFRLPPYFALIIRAISVLEGIALVGNPEFAIIDEAFPWIAKKLLTDESPRLREALKYLVYGKEGIFDADRLIDVLVAFEKYGSIKNEGDGSAFKVAGVRGGRDLGDGKGSKRGTKLVDLSDRNIDGEGGRFKVEGDPEGTGSDGGKVMLSTGGGSGGGRGDDAAAREALRFFFSEDGSFFRTFMLDEIADTFDCVSRDVIFTIGKRFGLSPDLKIPGTNFLLLPGVGLLRR